MGADVDITLVISTFAPIAKVDTPWKHTFEMGAKVDITLEISTFAPIAKVDMPWNAHF